MSREYLFYYFSIYRDKLMKDVLMMLLYGMHAHCVQKKVSPLKILQYHE